MRLLDDEFTATFWRRREPLEIVDRRTEPDVMVVVLALVGAIEELLLVRFGVSLFQKKRTFLLFDGSRTGGRDW
jgi:hypothetical protein